MSHIKDVAVRCKGDKSVFDKSCFEKLKLITSPGKIMGFLAQLDVHLVFGLTVN